jgi:riboflavin synthase
MFTGIVTAIGTVREAASRDGGLDLAIEAPYSGLEPGESIAVDGACLTVETAAPGRFKVHLIRTTLDRTRFEDYVTGRRVTLERALQAGDRLGGHLVQAHVDGIGQIERVSQREDARLLDVRVPPQIAQLTMELGSITVDGVSLTVNAKPARELIQISLIPFTLQHTTLGDRVAGDRVHLEADAIAKYVAALLEEQKRER